MDEPQFWRIIDESRERSDGDLDAQMEILVRVLAALSVSEIFAFERIFTEHWIGAYTWPLWGAAYLVGGGCSDDGFMDFRGWLVSRGETAYENALADPDSLADVLDDGEDGQVEGFQYVAGRAWEQVTGGDIEDFPRSRPLHPEEPTGKRCPDEELEAQFPRLARIAG